MKNTILLLAITAPIICFGQSTRLYTPQAGLFSTQQSFDNIGINNQRPEHTLHIHETGDRTTAFQIDLFEQAIETQPNPPQGPIGISFEAPQYVMRSTLQQVGLVQPTQTFSVDLNGKIRSGLEDSFSATERLAMSAGGIGIYYNSAAYLKARVRNDRQAQFLWRTVAGKNLEFKNEGTSVVGMTLTADGRVGVKTADFFDSHEFYVGGSAYIRGDASMPHSLYAEGSIITEEAFVKLKAEWPDYVFKEDYSLMPLEELDQFIKENGHLPEMPTAEEVVENGLALGETNRLLTQKVEELTLYILELKKEVDGLKAEVK